MTNYALVQLELDFCPNDCVYKIYFDLCLQISAARIITSHALLRGISFEIEEFIELIKRLLLVLFFARTFRLACRSFLPELICCLLSLPSCVSMLLGVVLAAPCGTILAGLRTLV